MHCFSFGSEGFWWGNKTHHLTCLFFLPILCFGTGVGGKLCWLLKNCEFFFFCLKSCGDLFVIVTKEDWRRPKVVGVLITFSGQIEKLQRKTRRNRYGVGMARSWEFVCGSGWFGEGKGGLKWWELRAQVPNWTEKGRHRKRWW